MQNIHVRTSDAILALRTAAHGRRQSGSYLSFYDDDGRGKGSADDTWRGLTTVTPLTGRPWHILGSSRLRAQGTRWERESVPLEFSFIGVSHYEGLCGKIRDTATREERQWHDTIRSNGKGRPYRQEDRCPDRLCSTSISRTMTTTGQQRMTRSWFSRTACQSRLRKFEHTRSGHRSDSRGSKLPCELNCILPSSSHATRVAAPNLILHSRKETDEDCVEAAYAAHDS